MLGMWASIKNLLSAKQQSLEVAGSLSLFVFKQTHLHLNTWRQTSPPSSSFALSCVPSAAFVCVQVQSVFFFSTYREREDEVVPRPDGIGPSVEGK